MKPIATAAAAALLLLGGTAQAQMMSPAWYGELGYTFLKVDARGTSLRPQALRGIIGYEFHPMFAVEGMAGFGVNEDNKTVSVNGVPTDVEVKLSSMYGIWLKPKYVMNQFELFGRIGYSHTKIKTSSPNASLTGSESDDDLSYGLGVNFRFNPRMYAGVDWMRYSKQSGNKVDGLTISVGYHW